MIDTSKVTKRIQSRSQAESPQLRRHRGVVQSMAGDGTVGITLDGGSTVITGVRRLLGIPINVGDTVEMLGDDTDLIIVGPVFQALSGNEHRASSLLRYNAGVSGVRIEDTNGDAHTWLPYIDGNFYFTNRPDIGGGKWFFRTYEAAANKYTDVITFYASGLMTGGSEPWTPVSFMNGYTNYGGGWQTTSFRREPGNTVRLRGLMSGSDNTSNAIFQLPSGYRPPDDIIVVALGTTVGGSNSYRINIRPDGYVLAERGENPTFTPTFLSLSGITFSNT